MNRMLPSLCHLQSLVCVGLCLSIALVQAAAGADLFERAVQEADVDFELSRCYVDGKPQPVDAENLKATLEFAEDHGREWRGGHAPGDGSTVTYLYVVALKRPVAVGSMLYSGPGDSMRLLKPGASWPPDPSRDEDWTTVEFRSRQSGARLVTLPVGTEIRAAMVVDQRKQWWSRIERWEFLKHRLHNFTNLALAYAETEYTATSDLAPPYTYGAWRITKGQGEWRNAGRDDKGRIRAAPISPDTPTWFMLAWPEPQTIEGLWLLSNLRTFELYRFRGPDNVHPRVGTEREWKEVREFSVRRTGRRGSSFVAFDEPVHTRGLKIKVTSVHGHEPEVASLKGLHVLVQLGERETPPLPDFDARPEVSLPPVTVDYELPWDGMVTVAIDGPDGRRVRNLVARAERKAGPQRDGWDLTDDAGVSVKPGEYTAKVIAHPPLDLCYQFTVYPNVSQLVPENSAWQNGTHGPGGWMADHSPPSSIAVAEDTVYLGSRVAESGVSLIETDLRGAKRWGYHTLHEGFGGPWFLATDDQRIYVAARDTMLWSFDIETKEKRDVLDRPQTARRKDRITGLAARDGKLYLAQCAQPWLANAVSPDDVEIDHCLPRHRRKREPMFKHEAVPDPQGDFLRLLRLTGTPPGHGQDLGLVWLESTSGQSARQYVMVSFKRPVPIGSIVFPRPAGDDYEVRFSYQKVDAPYPPNPRKKAQWSPFDGAARLAKAGAKGEGPQVGGAPAAERPAWDVVPAPANLVTRALLISFVKKGATELEELERSDEIEGGEVFDLRAGADTEDKDDLAAGEGRPGDFRGRLEGLKILRRRYVNAAPGATVRVSSGKVSPDGVWDAQRTKALSERNPGVYALVWDRPQSLRGLAIKEIDGRVAKIDVYRPSWEQVSQPVRGQGGEREPAADIDINAADGWVNVATYQQPLRLYYFPNDAENKRARYLDGYVPFESEVTTQAVRIRVVEQYVRQEQHYPYGFREDLGEADWDASRCRIYGVAALSHIGGEPETDPLMHQRIEVLDGENGKTLQEVHLENPGPIAFASDGPLYGISSGNLVRIDLESGKHRPLVTDLERPQALAIDASGKFYIFDNAPERQNIRIYDPDGKLLRTIGKPGGRTVPGPWDEQTFVNVTGLGVDRTNQLWVVENNYWPKRVSVWTTEGQFQKEFLGPTSYGSGGILDPFNKKRFFYGPLEFELDWEKGTSRIKQVTHSGDALHAPQLPVKIGDRMYLANHGGWDAHGPVAVIYLQEGGTYRQVAAFGLADNFPPLNRAEALDELGVKTLQGKIFIWTDRNGDQQVQQTEVQIEDKPRDYRGVGKVNRRLNSIGGKHHYVVKEFLPNGVPVYERRYQDKMHAHFLWQLDNGLYHRMHSNWLQEGSDAWMRPNGEIEATYPSEKNSGFALPTAGPYTPEQVVCQFKWVGHETAPGGDLGEFVVLNSNVAQWFLWTADGLLAGRLFRDMRDPTAIPWSMKEHDRGLQMRDFNIFQEHFEGYFTRTFEDGKFYAVAGHNHASLVEVNGLDRFKRWNEPLEVSLEAVVKTGEWVKKQKLHEVARRAPVIDCYQVGQPPRIDGHPGDWDFVSADIGENIRFSIGYDQDFLYLCYRVENLGPLKNTGEDWRLLFKSGASVDLQLGRNPGADPKRRAPTEGDLRLLMTSAKGRPAAVLYEPVARDADEADAWTVTSPVGKAEFDRVVQLRDVRMAGRETGRGYVFEAAVPLRTLKIKPEGGQRMKMDWGILRTGPDGYEVLERIYWSNKATTITADRPSEARLSPDMWGHILFHSRKGGAGDAPPLPEAKLKQEDETGKEEDPFLEDLEDD